MAAIAVRHILKERLLKLVVYHVRTFSRFFFSSEMCSQALILTPYEWVVGEPKNGVSVFVIGNEYLRSFKHSVCFEFNGHPFICVVCFFWTRFKCMFIEYEQQMAEIAMWLDDEMYLAFNRYYDMPLFHDGHNFSLLFKCFSGICSVWPRKRNV